MRRALSRLVVFFTVVAVWSPAFVLAQGGTLRVGIPAFPSELDPATALEGSVPLIARQVFDTLVQYTETGSDLEPALAADWNVSRDGLIWSFRLRSGVTFHDGTPLTAQHVAQSLEREIFPGHAMAPASSVAARLLRGMPGVVKHVRAKDARTVEIGLQQPYAPLLAVLAHPSFSIVLPAPSGGAGGNRWQGTGPFAIGEIGAGRIVLDARPGHWRAPRLGHIVFVDTTDEARALAALDGQTLDVLFPAGAPPRLSGAMFVPGWRIGYLALQTGKEPFRRAKVRRAVAAALAPGLLAGALGSSASPLQGFVPVGAWGRRDGAPIMSGDPEQAKRLLAEAGVPPGASVTLLIVEGDKRVDQTRVAEAIRGALGAAGLTVRINTEAGDGALALAQAGEHQLVLGEARAEAGDPHFLLYPLSTSEAAVKGAGALNLSFYRDTRLDDLLIRSSQLSFRPERQRLYSRAQAMLAEALPWIPLYVDLHWALVRPEVKNLRLHPSGNPRLERVVLERPPAPSIPPPSPGPAAPTPPTPPADTPPPGSPDPTR